jgi:histidine triad (HIT) family protein
MSQYEEVWSMENCIFCKIARGDIKTDAVYENDRIIAFKDLNPGAPVHILIIPKAHISGVMALEDADKSLVGEIFLVARHLAEQFGIAEDGFRVVVNSGENAGQSVPHLHFHLLGGRKLGWPPG